MWSSQCVSISCNFGKAASTSFAFCRQDIRVQGDVVNRKTSTLSHHAPLVSVQKRMSMSTLLTQYKHTHTHAGQQTINRHHYTSIKLPIEHTTQSHIYTHIYTPVMPAPKSACTQQPEMKSQLFDSLSSGSPVQKAALVETKIANKEGTLNILKTLPPQKKMGATKEETKRTENRKSNKQFCLLSPGEGRTGAGFVRRLHGYPDSWPFD